MCPYFNLVVSGQVFQPPPSHRLFSHYPSTLSTSKHTRNYSQVNWKVLPAGFFLSQDQQWSQLKTREKGAKSERRRDKFEMNPEGSGDSCTSVVYMLHQCYVYASPVLCYCCTSAVFILHPFYVCDVLVLCICCIRIVLMLNQYYVYVAPVLC